jgi:hypothetical protein
MNERFLSAGGLDDRSSFRHPVVANVDGTGGGAEPRSSGRPSSMTPAPVPVNDRRRIAAFRACGLLDTPPEESFDRVTRVTRRLLGVPMAPVARSGRTGARTAPIAG